MVGPLKGRSHKKKYLLVMVDKFTKWIEAKPVKTAEAGPVIDFISGVVPRYGVPHNNITGGSATEITPSTHLIMAVIAPWTEPFLAYLTRQELPEDPNEARCIVRCSKA